MNEINIAENMLSYLDFWNSHHRDGQGNIIPMPCDDPTCRMCVNYRLGGE